MIIERHVFIDLVDRRNDIIWQGLVLIFIGLVSRRNGLNV